MKPWEETWKVGEQPSEKDWVYFGDGSSVSFEAFNSEEDEARARLAAQAPAMARLLLECLEEFDVCSRDEIREVLQAAGMIP